MKDHLKRHRDSLIDNLNPLEMEAFFDMVTGMLTVESDEGLPEDFSHEIHLMPGECVYITDYKAKRLLFKKGFEQLLGYSDDEVDFEFVFKGYHHEDAVIVSQVIKAFVASAVNSFKPDPDQQLSMTYRRKRKDGSYIHLLSQSSVYELDAKGNLLRSYTKLSDISYLNIAIPVSYSVRSKNMDQAYIQKKLLNIFENPFTTREIEIIKEIQIGGSNRDIAERLHVSHHTIATHRKNILRKSNCHNVLDLLVYAKQLKII